MDEIETKLDADDHVELPPFEGLAGGLAVERRDAVVLDATYWDTVDLALLHAGVTLRHRSEPGFTGWHLKLPHGTATAGAALHRVELAFDGEPDAPPAGAVEHVRDFAARGDLRPVAEVRTARTEVVVRRDGEDPVVVADDRVAGRDLRDADARGTTTATVRFRELEVEGAEGDVAAAVVAALRAAGARTGGTAPKVARVLGLPSTGGR